MGQSGYSQAHRTGRLHTPLGPDHLVILRMTATERISEPFTIVIDAVSERAPVNLHPTLGEEYSVEFEGDAALSRWFHGRLWEYVELDKDEQGYHYRLTLRPWTAFRTLNRNNRIFQQKSIKEIAQAVLGQESLQLKLQTSYPAIDYCVQYQESDFDFVSRLLEHEGIYYYFDHDSGGHALIAVDDRQSHPALKPSQVRLFPRHEARLEETCLWSLSELRAVGPAKHVVDDYDFESPSKKLQLAKAAAQQCGKPPERWGGGSSGAWAAPGDVYSFPAKFDAGTTQSGERYSERWLAADRQRMARSVAEGNFFAAAVGRTVTVAFPAEGASCEYLIIGTIHRYDGPQYRSGSSGGENMTVEVELMPASEQYRPALRTPRPRVFGPQTAVVVGPPGEEIYTDQYGRIKVQFHWDREGKADDKSSCWIRVIQWSAGRSWGSFMLPRVGQEVVVEFLDGDPDRPIVTGAVYNGDNNAPVALPSMKTVQGIKTRSTTGGGGHNELLFDDKKDAELVSLRAQKDLQTVVDTGNETHVLENGSRTTTIKKGDETLDVSKGKRTTTIYGNETLEVKTGNRVTTVTSGNDTLTVKTGDAEVKVNLGKHSTEAMTSIELKCGMSSIKLDPDKITIKAVNVEIKGQMTVKIDGVMVESSASGVQKVKGSVVFIN